MATLAQKWLEEGIQQGLQRGREEGRREGLQRGLQQGPLKAWRVDVVAMLRLRLQPNEAWQQGMAEK